MNTDRIKEIQKETGYPESVSVQQALLKVWNETEQEQLRIAAVSYQLPHYFNAPDEDKSSRFCICGKYLTDDVHLRQS